MGENQMKVIAHDRYGSADELEWREAPDPTPGPGQVVLDVHAASVNPLDVHMMTGTPMLVRLGAGLRRPKLTVRGADVAGVVTAVADDVTDLAVGDRVFGMARGSFAERAVASAGALAPMPDAMSFGEAAALPVAAVTALQGLRDHARVPAGGSVLIIGAAGGVGTFAVQLAVAMGLEVTGVCSAQRGR
ncbi:MAG: NAD(P)-dependent alcohol dehydrogenase [Ilumatobacteraceae bacterium]